MIEVDKLTPEEIISLKAQYKLCIEHIKYFNDTMKHFKYPEKRIKTFDTMFYEKNIPEIRQALQSLGQL